MNKRKGLAVLWIGLWLLAACGGRGESFPAFVYSSALSLDSYRAAVAMPPGVTEAIPCYCGCRGLNPPHGHLRDCFFLPQGGFSDHASGCDLCGRIVLDVQRAYRQGVPLGEIRERVEGKYAIYGGPTDTPPVSRYPLGRGGLLP